MCSDVGATSASRPPSVELLALECGRPPRSARRRRSCGRCAGRRWSGSIICSQLPWSAVDDRDAACRWTASRIRPTQTSTCSTALTAAASTPVWPTMSPLAKLTTIRSYSVAVDPPHDLVGDPVRAHLRLLVVGADLGAGDHEAGLRRGTALAVVVEEERDVGEFLRLGAAELLQPEVATRSSPRMLVIFGGLG